VVIERRGAFHVAEQDDVTRRAGLGLEAGFDVVPVAVDVADEDDVVAGVVQQAQGRRSGVGAGG
jgi:hypothetical protein